MWICPAALTRSITSGFLALSLKAALSAGNKLKSSLYVMPCVGMTRANSSGLGSAAGGPVDEGRGTGEPAREVGGDKRGSFFQADPAFNFSLIPLRVPSDMAPASVSEPAGLDVKDARD